MTRRTSWLLLLCFLFLGIYIGLKLPTRPTNRIGGSLMTDVLQLIDKNYVDTVNFSQMEEQGVTRMLEYLDPHSVYLPPVEYKEADDELQGQFEGIGIMFRMIQDTLTVLMPVKGGPSEAVGIMAGDRIVIVDTLNIAGKQMDVNDIVKRLKGPKGTQVKLRILRPGIKKLFTFTVTRDIIPTYSIDASLMVDRNTGYIKISKFSATTGDEFHTALKKLQNQGMQKLVIDLRGNGGGFLDQAIKVADELLAANSLIVYTQGLHREKDEAFASEKGLFKENPLVIIIDEWSASASEIIAGAIQDNDRGMIVGRRSFGKGLVQEQMPMRNGSAIRLTVARYYTPSGRCIQKPYTHNAQDYEETFMNQYINGAFGSIDSIKFDSTQVYQTLKGRTVYGGGGIMPDVFVPYKSDSSARFYNLLINRGILVQFAFQYTDKNRNTLNRYKNTADFKQKFTISDDIFQELINYSTKQGLTPNQIQIHKYKPRIETLLKANIARNLFDDEGFYSIYLSMDDDFAKAMETLKN